MAEPDGDRRATRRGWGGVARDLAIVVGAFVLASALAGALGAVDLGTALAFGQIALAMATVYVMVKR